MKYPKEYYVPVVVKNRDYLIGFFDAVSSFAGIFEIDYSSLDSMRLTDVLPNGQRRRHLTEQEILDVLSECDAKNNIKEHEVTEKTSDVIEIDIPFLEVNCSCGNYVSYNHPNELPKTTRVCELCGKIMIDYTGHDQDEYEYDGDIDKMMVGIDEGFIDDDSEDDAEEDED